MAERVIPGDISPENRSLRSLGVASRHALRFRLRHLGYRFEYRYALRFDESPSEGQTRTDVRPRTRGIVARTRVRNATVRARIAATTEDHTGRSSAEFKSVTIECRRTTACTTSRDYIHILAVNDSGNPKTSRSTLYLTCRAVGHLYIPYALLPTTIGNSDLIHHIPFMTINILIAEAVGVVQTNE